MDIFPVLTAFLDKPVDPLDAEYVLFGAPLDMTTSNRRGARFGPDAIRRESRFLDTFSQRFKMDWDDLMLADIGNIRCESLDTCLGNIESVINCHHTLFPVMLGGEHTITLGALRALKPDLVVVWASGNNKKQVDKLIKMGLTVFISEPRQITDIYKTIQRFGKLAGTNNIAEKSAEKFIKYYEYLKEKYSNKEKVKIFYQFWNKPLMTINGQHIISNIINLCGGTNVFAKLNSLTPIISIEAVIASQTDVIVVGSNNEKKSKWISEWKPWLHLAAVKKDHLYFIDPDLLNRMGPRILSGADQLCELLDKARKN